MSNKKEIAALWEDYDFQSELITTHRVLDFEGADTNYYSLIRKAHRWQGKLLKQLNKKGAFKK